MSLFKKVWSVALLLTIAMQSQAMFFRSIAKSSVASKVEKQKFLRAASIFSGLGIMLFARVQAERTNNKAKRSLQESKLKEDHDPKFLGAIDRYVEAQVRNTPPYFDYDRIPADRDSGSPCVD
jgi:hypothetical protein